MGATTIMTKEERTLLPEIVEATMKLNYTERAIALGWLIKAAENSKKEGA